MIQERCAESLTVGHLGLFVFYLGREIRELKILMMTKGSTRKFKGAAVFACWLAGAVNVEFIPFAPAKEHSS